MLVFGWVSRRGSVTGIVPTDAMVERFDLLIIIVLGEVVTGVVERPGRRRARCRHAGDRLRGARGRFRAVVDLLRRGRAPAAALRRAHRQPLDGSAPAHRHRDRGGRSRDDRPHRACARTADPGSHGVAARRLGRAPARRPRRHDPHARRLSAPRRHLSTARLRDGRGGGCGPARRLAAAGRLAPRAAPGGHPRDGLAVRRRPIVQDRDVDGNRRVGRRGRSRQPPDA